MIETKILTLFDRELKRGFSPNLDSNLNHKEVELILVVNKFPFESMGFYCREIGLEKGSFTYLSELLIKKELIVQKENPRDSRSKVLDLTEPGKTIALIIREQLDAFIKERLSIYSEFELHQLKFAIETTKNLYDKLQHFHNVDDDN